MKSTSANFLRRQTEAISSYGNGAEAEEAGAGGRGSAGEAEESAWRGLALAVRSFRRCKHVTMTAVYGWPLLSNLNARAAWQLLDLAVRRPQALDAHQNDKHEVNADRHQDS